MPLHLVEAAALVGRLLLAAIFLHEAWSKLNGYAAAVAYTQAYGLPGELLPLAIATELGCGSLIVLGFYTRAAALILAGFCVVTAVVFHTNLGDHVLRRRQINAGIRAVIALLKGRLATSICLLNCSISLSR